MKTFFELLYSGVIFGSGILLGYYFGLCREHRLYMKQLDDLKKTLSDCDREHRKRLSQWESRLKN